jgi:hypothetical protein
MIADGLLSICSEAKPMKCPHCRIAFYAKSNPSLLGQDVTGTWQVDFIECPSCNNAIITLINGSMSKTPNGAMGFTFEIIPERIIAAWPRTSLRPPCPQEVPNELADDYKEACLVLTDSPKASAALSRRCLQNLLRDAAKVKYGDLANEIQQVLESNSLPTYIAEAIDAVRNIGNFAAHPMKSRTTGDIVPVEPEEASWNLNVLETLFDFYYVQPVQLLTKKLLLNQKLQELGKPPMK